jgi:hypothetical protein
VNPEGAGVEPPPLGGVGVGLGEAGGSRTSAVARRLAAEFFAWSSVRVTTMIATLAADAHYSDDDQQRYDDKRDRCR